MSGKRLAAVIGAALSAFLGLPEAALAERGAGSGDRGVDALLGAERTKLLAGSRTRVGVVLALRAPGRQGDASPAPVALALVMDRSASMSGAGKIEMVHAAGAGLVDRLDASDELGLVAYSDWSDVLRPMSAVRDRDGTKALIARLAPGGCTNLGDGLVSGLDFFRKSARNGHVRRLMLLTDGLANRGETDPEALSRWAAEAFSAGVRTTAIGLGQDYDEKLLAKIAHAGGGEFYYVATRSELPELFRAELEQGRSVVVKDLAATVRVARGARFVEMVGYPATGGTERAREVKVGDLFAKQERSTVLLFDLAPPECPGPRRWTAAAVDLTWTDTGGRKSRTSLPLAFGVTASEAAVAESAVDEVRSRVIENANYRALDEAMDLFRRGERERALEKIREAEDRIGSDPAAAGDGKIIAQAGELAQARREIEQEEDARSIAIHNTEVGCYGFRGGSGRRRQSMRAGGSRQSESAVDASKSWLAGHQAEDGSWGEGGDRRLETSLALLAFLGAGHTERTGRHRDAVARGIAWLITRQQADGRIAAGETPSGGPPAFREAYTHAACALALAEAFGMARVQRTGVAAQDAVDWLVTARPFALADEAFAGGAALTDDDVAGVGWCVMALKSARIAGLRVEGDAFGEAAALLDRHEIRADGEARGRYAFVGESPRRLDTMVGLAARASLGWKRADLLPVAKRLVLAEGGLPEWGDDGGRFDWYHAYFGNLVSFQMGGDVWRKWNSRLRDMLVAETRKGGGELDGSWDPVGSFSGRDRALATATAALCLEVYYRYLPMYR